MSCSSWNHFLLYESCVSYYRGAGITYLLIASYHQSVGSPPALGIWLTDNKSSRLAITLSHSALAAFQSWTLALVFFLSPFFSKTSFLSTVYLLDLLFYTFRLSLLPGVCHVIIFQSNLPICLEI